MNEQGRFFLVVDRLNVLLSELPLSISERETICSMTERLGECNYACYCANMRAIEARSQANSDAVIAACEGDARRVGEERVRIKGAINEMIGTAFTGTRPKAYSPQSWMTDDIVYSVGEMIDRLTIEWVKQAHFSNVPRDHPSVILSDRVWRVLKQKLDEIVRKGWYDVLPETRTYA